MAKGRHFTDDELVKLIQEGDTSGEIIRFLYRQYFEVLSVYVQTNSGALQDAEDVFQEVVVAFISLVQNRKFRGESSVKTFLYALNRNIWLNELKRRDRAGARNARYVKEGATEAPDAGQYIADREARAQLMKVVEELGDSCRQVLLLFYYENLSMKEILSHTRFENEQVVRNKKYKCLKQLEQLIKARPGLAQSLKSVLLYER